MKLSESISADFANMAKFNKSYGEFFDVNYERELHRKEFEDVDQMRDFNERGTNSLYATESWFDLSAQKGFLCSST